MDNEKQEKIAQMLDVFGYHVSAMFVHRAPDVEHRFNLCIGNGKTVRIRIEPLTVESEFSGLFFVNDVCVGNVYGAISAYAALCADVFIEFAGRNAMENNYGNKIPEIEEEEEEE